MGKTNTALIIGIGVIAIAVVGILALLFNASGSGTTGSVTESDTMTIPLSQVTQQARWYEYDSGGKTIRFFAVKASDGSVKTGFDECDVCYRSGKGYRQEGVYMVCNNCGNKYPITGLGTENKNPGGCWPGYLPSFIEGENLIIKKSDLDAGRWRFV